MQEQLGRLSPCSGKGHKWGKEQQKPNVKVRKRKWRWAHPRAALPPWAARSSRRGRACSGPQRGTHKPFLASGSGWSLVSLRDDSYFQRVPFRKQKVWAQKYGLVRAVYEVGCATKTYPVLMYLMVWLFIRRWRCHITATCQNCWWQTVSKFVTSLWKTATHPSKKINYARHHKILSSFFVILLTACDNSSWQLILLLWRPKRNI